MNFDISCSFLTKIYKNKKELHVFVCLIAIETCSPEEFHCAKHQPKCIPSTEVCDGRNDCIDGSDEVNCTASACPSYKYPCASRNQCIYKSWVCDGEADCRDGSDEQNCTTTSKCHLFNYKRKVLDLLAYSLH